MKCQNMQQEKYNNALQVAQISMSLQNFQLKNSHKETTCLASRLNSKSSTIHNIFHI
jgi:hypothetical protein